MNFGIDVERLVEGLRAHGSDLAAAAQLSAPGTRVPTCPAWSVEVLVAHVGNAHRWAAEVLRTRTFAPIPAGTDAGPQAGWGKWLHRGVEELLDAITETGAATEVWTFLGPRPASSWLRRMVHETAVHHADAALTAGAAFTIAPDLAADAISEGLDNVAAPALRQSRPDLAELRGCGETLYLQPERLAGWLITRTPDGVRWARGPGDGDVRVAGPVRELLLVLTGRLPAAEVTVAGDRALLDHWLTHTAL